MLRITFISKDNISFIGINGVASFFEAIEQKEFSCVQTIDDTFLAIIDKMKTFEYGFTKEFKEKFFYYLSKKKGEIIYLKDDLFITNDCPMGQYFKAFVKLLNEGKSFEEASEMMNDFKPKMKEENVET